MLLMNGMEKAFEACAGKIVEKYDISTSVEKMTDIIIKFGNDFTKSFWLTSLKIMNIGASFKSTDIKEELKNSIRQSLENVWSDLNPDQLDEYGITMDQTFDL